MSTPKCQICDKVFQIFPNLQPIHFPCLLSFRCYSCRHLLNVQLTSNSSKAAELQMVLPRLNRPNHTCPRGSSPHPLDIAIVTKRYIEKKNLCQKIKFLFHSQPLPRTLGILPHLGAKSKVNPGATRPSRLREEATHSKGRPITANRLPMEATR